MADDLFIDESLKQKVNIWIENSGLKLNVLITKYMGYGSVDSYMS